MKSDSTIRALESYIRTLKSNGEMLTDILMYISENISICETDEEFVRVLEAGVDYEDY